MEWLPNIHVCCREFTVSLPEIHMLLAYYMLIEN